MLVKHRLDSTLCFFIVLITALTATTLIVHALANSALLYDASGNLLLMPIQ